MKIIRILSTMGLKNGKEALGLLRQLRKAGGTNIQIADLTKNSFKVNCNLTNNREPSSFLFDFARNRQQHTTKFSRVALLPWDQRSKGTITEVANLSSGRPLKTVTHSTETINSQIKLEKTTINNHVTGTTLERHIKPDGTIEYYRQRENGPLERLFA